MTRRLLPSHGQRRVETRQTKLGAGMRDLLCLLGFQNPKGFKNPSMSSCAGRTRGLRADERELAAEGVAVAHLVPIPANG